jgi:hypothetical protein
MKLLTGYLVGAFWKGLSVISKFGFLLLIVPKLPNGVFSQYLVVFTGCLLSARLLSIGMEDQLPVIISGDTEKSEQFFPIYWWVVASGILMIVCNDFAGNHFFIYTAVICFQLSNFILCGIIRSYSPAGYEKLINLPAFFYFVLLLIFPADRYEFLLLIWVFGTALGQAVVLYVLKIRMSFLLDKNIGKEIIVILRLGFAKMISSFLALAAFRGLVIFPKYLLHILVGDTLAFAISIGEGCWQLAMVVVNRNYSYYCRHGGSLEKSLFSAGVVMAGMGLIGVVIIQFVHVNLIDKISWPLVGWSLVFFGAMAAFLELRYFCWAHGIMNKVVINVQLLFIGIEICVILFFSQSNWLAFTSLLSVFTVCTLIFKLWCMRVSINKQIQGVNQLKNIKAAY